MSDCILIVEDEVPHALDEARMLESYGYTTAVTNKAADAVAKVKEHQDISLILMDLDLGNDGDGTETARRILAVRELPVVFLTGHHEEEYLRKTEEVPCYGIVPKQCGELFLIETIKTALSLFETRRQMQREIEQRNKAEERIRESERRYRLLFEHANEAIVIFQDGQTKLFNEKTLELTGYTAEEYRGLTLDELVHPADLDMVRQRYWQRSAGIIADEPYEYRILTKSGTTKRMRMKPARILWEGRPASMGMIEDITELKETEAELQQALEEKDFLMRELNHRVKNNLYMISSLVNLKDEALGEQADLSDIRHQISAIEIVHDKLSSLEKVATVEIREYLTDLLDRLFSTSSFPEVRLETDMEALTLPTKKAVPLGLITNEIATNAVKYGFRHGEEAVFSVSLHRDPGDGRFVYILANTGAPFPEEVNFEDPDSLGLRLIRALVSQLDGTVELQKRPSPAFTIRFPAEEQ